MISHGSWTPVVSQLSSTTVAIGDYIKIDDLVVINFYITGTLSGGGHYFTIDGLPFVANTDSKWYGGGGHVQGLAYNHANCYFNGWVLDSSQQVIYGRGSQSTEIGTDMTGEYLYGWNASTIHASGTLMYKTT